MFITIMIGVAIFAVESISPIVFGLYVERVVLGGRIDVFLYVAFSLVLIWVAISLLKYVDYIVKVKFGNDLLLNIKESVLNFYFNLSHKQYDSLDVGEAKMRIEDDSSYIRHFVDSQFVNLLIGYITFFICLIFLFITEWRLACYSIAVVPIVMLVDLHLSKKEKVLNEQNRLNDADMSNWLQASLAGWRDIKALCLEKSQERKYNHFLKKHAVYYGQWIYYWATRVLVIPQIRDVLLTRFGLYFLGGLLIIQNKLHISELLIFSLYFEKLLVSIKGISTCDAELISGMPHTNRIIEQLNIREQDKSTEILVDFSLNQICLNNVDFKYPNKTEPVFHDLNLTINKGDRIAIVGKSGCGKTTLIKLISGLTSPTEGCIQYNGIDQCRLNIDSLHKHIGLVMQENVLFNASIRENLRYGKEDASNEEIRDACEKACIWDYIDGLPNKLDSVIGERGINISAGQRQRLVLARMFLQSPDVYVFDEATSNLDPYTEAFIHDALNYIRQEKTILLISHRESTWKLCDKVFCVETGRFIRQNGTRAE